jgi:hypothetical protein
MTKLLLSKNAISDGPNFKIFMERRLQTALLARYLQQDIVDYFFQKPMHQGSNFIAAIAVEGAWAYGKEKIRGAERNLPDFFGLCPRCEKKFSGETFQNCCRRGGRSDYEKFLLDSIFPTKLTEFPTKLTEFDPFIFIMNQYCPTGFVCPTNWGGLPPPRPVRP